MQSLLDMSKVSGKRSAGNQPPVSCPPSKCLVCSSIIQTWDSICPDMYSTGMRCIGITISYSLSLFGALKKPFEPHELPSTVIINFIYVQLKNLLLQKLWKLYNWISSCILSIFYRKFATSAVSSLKKLAELKQC